MVRYHTKRLLLAGILLAVMFLVHPVIAQNYWMYPGGGKSISIEVYKPSFDDIRNLGLFNSVWFLSGNLYIDKGFTVVFEVPISNFDVDSEFSGYISRPPEDEMLLGNPYIGFESEMPMSDHSQSTIIRAGIRLPLASEEKRNANSIGILTTVNRFEAFISDLITLSFSGGYNHTLEGGIEYSLNVGGALMMPTEDNSEDNSEAGSETELYIDYNAEFWFPSGKVNLGAGLAGRLLATEGDLDFGERTVHQLGLAANCDFGGFKPGIHLRMPLDKDLTDILNSVYGFNVTYRIK